MERREISAVPFECVLGWMLIYIPITSKLAVLQLSIGEESFTILPCISITIHRIQHNTAKVVGSLNMVHLVQSR
jgi:hypothetical protein